MINNFTELYKDTILSIVDKHVPGAKIILYGSRARGDAREGSDIDIALDASCKIDASVMSDIIGDLEESDIPINFDVVDFCDVSESLQKEIIKDGIVWKK